MAHGTARLAGTTRIRIGRRSAALLVALATLIGWGAPAQAQGVATVVTWNRALIAALSVPGTNPATVFTTRPQSMASIAVFDALNSFDRLYHPYAGLVDVPSGASRDAAVAQAAHDVLVALLPGQTAAFDAALATSLAGIASGAARDGAAVGAAAATAVLALRTGDGWERPFPPFEMPSLPGYWKPTPPANLNATFTNYPYVQGFIVENGRHFLMEGPPAMTSERYATDFNETKSYGAVGSTVRTADQTQAAQVWAGVGTSTQAQFVWNLVFGDLAASRGLSALDAARGFALLNMAQHDALMTSFTAKFIYGFWRPVHAVRGADADGNGATEADPAWTPLLVTPPYPGHPGNMACLGASQSRVMARLFGRDDIPFSVTWTGTTNPSVTRSYNGFRQLSDEEANSRIWGGIHFRFESLASIGSCSQLGDYAVDNVLRQR